MFAISIREMISSRTAITDRMIFTAFVTVRIVSAAFWPLLTSSMAGLMGLGLPFGPGGTIAFWIERRLLALSGWTTTASGSGFFPWSCVMPWPIAPLPTSARSCLSPSCFETKSVRSTWGILLISFWAAFACLVVESGNM